MTSSTETRSLLRAALPACVAAAALLGASGAWAQAPNVGVTAAVNVDAQGRPPGAAPRVLALGNSVVFNEEITTDATGLAQILLLDGTTFTVGPNSQLVIDEFVYDPNTGDARVVASLTRGAFRFVGARTSQAPGGAIVRTPVGTIGIRGAVSNVSYDPNQGTTSAALLAGNCISLSRDPGNPDDSCIVYKAGFTVEIGADGSVEVHKTTKEEAQGFQQQVSGKPGTSGGTQNPPGDAIVAQSGVPQTNSLLPDSMIVPGSPNPVESTPPDKAEEDVADIGGATQDQVNEELPEEGGEEPPPPPATQDARVLTAPESYVTDDGEALANNGPRGLVGGTPGTDQIFAFFQENGRLKSTAGGIDLPDYTGTEGDVVLQPLPVGDGTSASGPVSGIAYAGAGDFVAYLLGVDGNPENPFYVIYGTPTDQAALLEMDSGSDVRQYTLTRDPIQDLPVPFFNNDIYQGGFAAGTWNASNLFVIEPGESGSGNIRAFQSWVSIEGTGTSQKSAAFIYSGNLVQREDGNLQLGGGRRGSFRQDAFDGSANMRGGIGTLAGAGGAHLFGENADNFVVGTPLDPVDTFTDSSLSDDFGGDNPEGYSLDGHFSTHHVADLLGEIPISDFTRSFGGEGQPGSEADLMLGFMAGMGESNDGSGPYRLSSGLGEANLRMRFNPVENTFGARSEVFDAGDDSGFADNLLLTFGHHDGDSGASAYIDDATYGASHNSNTDKTRLRTDGGMNIANMSTSSPGSFILSGRANPIAGYQHLEGCTTCDFIQWGWWGTRVQTSVDYGDGPETRRDFVHMGTWVAGDVSDPEAIYNGDTLPFGGAATYSGTALGTVARQTEGGVAQYVARGDMDMFWDFQERAGQLDITDFDGMDASGSLFDPGGTAGSGRFQGFLGGDVGGQASGAFVNDGPNVAHGVIGDFTMQGEGVSAVGTFAGIGSGLR